MIHKKLFKRRYSISQFNEYFNNCEYLLNEMDFFVDRKCEHINNSGEKSFKLSDEQREALIKAVMGDSDE